MPETLLDKVWASHKVADLETGEDQLFIGLHLIHEVTSPQAFHMLKQRGLKVLHPERTFATVDHIVPTLDQSRPFADALAEEMMAALEENVREYGIQFFDLSGGNQGIVHIIGPELGLTQPGMTIVCGDSHTSTHGAFGSIAFGIGTSQIRDVLATQSMAARKPKLRLIRVDGELGRGIFAKDIILRIIADLGAKGGIGYAYEYGGSGMRNLSMEERMTVCNMSIEGGSRCGYVNPDDTTFDYIRGRKYAPEGDAFDRAVKYWKSVASDTGAEYDDIYTLDASSLEPMVTWGINPGQGTGVGGTIPRLTEIDPVDRETARYALNHMQFSEGRPIKGQKIDVAFLGSCTNGRISDLRAAAALLTGSPAEELRGGPAGRGAGGTVSGRAVKYKAAPHVKALVVPGSRQVARQAEAEGLDEIFRQAGFQWRGAGCSMCLAMNPDRLEGDQICASSSNRNFIGRQGSPKGRTLLMSPAMVAAAAVAGEVTDVRELL